MDWGEFKLYRISDGRIWLDGGAMFGVVPKTLWERKTTPDEQNRIPLGLNCLLVDTGNHRVLIDTGCGFKYSDKELEIYRIEHETDVISELKKIDVRCDSIDFVINTHLHFDHCGGNTRLDNGPIVPTFPNATYMVQSRELHDAQHVNARTRATYFSHNWDPLEEAGLLRELDGEADVVPGIRCVPTPGHTLGHQSVRIESGGKTLFYIADLCPTRAHVPLAWIMGYDLFPLTTMETRQRIYRQAVEEEWEVFFEHDPDWPHGRIVEGERGYASEALDWESG